MKRTALVILALVATSSVARAQFPERRAEEEANSMPDPEPPPTATAPADSTGHAPGSPESFSRNGRLHHQQGRHGPRT